MSEASENEQVAPQGLLIGSLGWWLTCPGREAEVGRFCAAEQTYVDHWAPDDIRSTGLAVARFYTDGRRCGAAAVFARLFGSDYEKAYGSAVTIQRATRRWLKRTRVCDHWGLFGGACRKRYVPHPDVDGSRHSRCALHLCACQTDEGRLSKTDVCCVCGKTYCVECGMGCACGYKPRFGWL